ncbi:MAG: type II secretion system F family protein [Aigarchaeota archaeon]|nr:type II secretion system F family protein [Aigarchaeota archaeon]MDW8092576.1 type II secretion system F family protein [Nitrososphaerota archaeon]
MLTLNREWGYKLADSFSVISKSAHPRWLSELLKRVSQAINIGIRLSSIIRGEFSKAREIIIMDFERRMDRLKTLGDAFSAMLSSLSFLLIAITLLSFLMGGEAKFILTLLIYVIAGIYGAFIAYSLKVSVHDRLFNGLPNGSLIVYLIEKYSPPLLVVVSLSAGLTILFSGEPNVLLSLILPGAALAVPTFIARRVVSSISIIDKYAPFLMKDLCETLSLTNVIERSLEVVRVNDYGPLSRHISRLHLRLKSGIDQEVAWRAFMAESGSQLLREVGEVFIEGVKRGAPIKELGRLLYDHLSDRLAMRRRRQQVAGYIKGLVIPITLSVSGILGLMDTLFMTLGLISELTRGIEGMIFTFVDVGDLKIYSLLFLLVVSIGGGLFVHVVERRSFIDAIFYTGLLLSVSGTVYLVVANLAVNLLSGFTQHLFNIPGQLR